MFQSFFRAVRTGSWRALIAAWLHFEVSFMVWLLIGALSIAIAEQFALSATQTGLLVAVPLLGGACLRIPVGLATDRYGPKLMGLVLLLCEMIALLFGWLTANNYGQMLAVGLLLGTAGASFAVALPLASRAYPPAHQGLAMGVAASANSGTVLAAFFAPRLAELVGWHGVFGIMLLPVLLTTAAFAVMVPPQTAWQAPLHPTPGNAPRGTLSRDGSMYWLCFLYSVTFGGFVGFCSLLPMFLHDQYHVGLLTAGSVTAICGLAGSAARPLGGYLADRLGGPPVLAPVLLSIAGLVGTMSGLPSFPAMVTLVVMAVAVMGFGNGVVFRMVSDRFRDQIGWASGIIGAAGGFGGFLLPSWVGLLKDLSGTYRTGLWAFAACSLVAWFSTVQVRRRALRMGESVAKPNGFSH